MEMKKEGNRDKGKGREVGRQGMRRGREEGGRRRKGGRRENVEGFGYKKKWWEMKEAMSSGGKREEAKIQLKKEKITEMTQKDKMKPDVICYKRGKENANKRARDREKQEGNSQRKQNWEKCKENN